MNKAVFLDRDGTVNEEVHYLSDSKDLKLLPRVAEAIKMFNDAEYKVIIITNQSAIAKGFLTIEKLNEIHEKLLTLLNKKGAKIDAIYYCPHHPNEGCMCRKPKPGLLLKASKEHNIDLNRSYMVGDKLTDIEAGKRAGCKTILVKTGYGKEEIIKINTDNCPDFITDNLYEAAKIIISDRMVLKFFRRKCCQRCLTLQN